MGNLCSNFFILLAIVAAYLAFIWTMCLLSICVTVLIYCYLLLFRIMRYESIKIDGQYINEETQTTRNMHKNAQFYLHVKIMKKLIVVLQEISGGLNVVEWCVIRTSSRQPTLFYVWTMQKEKSCRMKRIKFDEMYGDARDPIIIAVKVWNK